MKNTEKIIMLALEEVSGYFVDDTVRNVKELVSVGELGVALELLCCQLVEFNIKVTAGLQEQLAIGAKSMQISIDEIMDLEIL